LDGSPELPSDAGFVAPPAFKVGVTSSPAAMSGSIAPEVGANIQGLFFGTAQRTDTPLDTDAP
jgi:hypothetical protein